MNQIQKTNLSLVAFLVTFILIGILLTKNYVDRNVIIRSNNDSISANNLKIREQQKIVDSLKKDLAKQDVEYIYIEQKQSETIKTYKHEKSIIDHAPFSEQLELFTKNLKRLDSLNKQGYFDFNQQE
jgi:hypothetical protein